jgi:hypothetical protein
MKNRLVEQMDKATEAELNGFKVRLKFEVLSYGEINNHLQPTRRHTSKTTSLKQTQTSTQQKQLKQNNTKTD